MKKIIQGDCLEELKKLEDNTIDAVVTDPPYELGFMGKSWDNTGIANNTLMWKECLRVLKPGGYLISFGGTRTYHRMAVAIENAGFEVRDMIEWVYGSGFPKSLNIGKAVDKMRGNKREKIDSYRTGEGANFKYSGDGKEQLHEATAKEIEITKGNSEWEGWGTALKPAHEPICMARKPLESNKVCENCNGSGEINIGANECWICKGTGFVKSKKLSVAENCLKYGTGGINIDESRVESNEVITTHSNGKGNTGDGGIYGHYDTVETGNERTGRFPSNLIHDNSEEVRECFPSRFFKSIQTQLFPEKEKPFSSLIYQAKASKSERNKGCEGLDEKNFGFSGGANGAIERGEDYSEGQEIGLNRVSKMKNNHPTVKPIALMEYLIKMITTENAVVLDPFAGSGTTGVACKKLNRNFVLIEKEPEYIEIIKKRIQ